MGAYRLEMKLFIVLSALLAMLFTASATGAEQPLAPLADVATAVADQDERQDERVEIRYLVLEDDVRLPPILLQDC